MLNTTISSSSSPSSSSLSPFIFHVTLPHDPHDPQDLQDPLDAALVQAKQRIEEGNRELINLERKFLIFLGKRLGDLEQEQTTLQKEIALKQHSVTALPKLYKELWTAHSEVTRVSMESLTGIIANFVKSFKDFQTSFPAEAISQIQATAVPSSEWLTTMKTFVTKRPVQGFLPPKVQKTQMQFSLVPKPGNAEQLQLQSQLQSQLRLPCVGRMESPSLSPYLQELTGLEEQMANMKKALLMFEEEEQALKRQQVQLIEAWNDVFNPYLNMTRLFKDKLADSLKQLSQESLILHAKCDAIKEVFRLPSDSVMDPADVAYVIAPYSRRLEEHTKKTHKTSLLYEQVQLIVPLIENMLFKTPVAPVAKAELKESNS